MRALFYVQHLLGTGHLQRIALIASELATLGAEVHVVSGGMSVATIDTSRVTLHQLDPLRAFDASFSRLVDSRGNSVDDAHWSRRRRALLNVEATIQPDVIVVETWPFGRRAFRHELMALMQQARSRKTVPVTFASVRDILQRNRKPSRIQETTALVLKYFDHVLVHGDPAFATLGFSFPQADVIADRTVYTGFVVRPDLAIATERAPQAREGGVVVSAGGGAVGEALYRASLEAALLLPQLTWRLLIGRNLGEGLFNELSTLAPEHVEIEWARADFHELLARASVSVSQAGYNTIMDLLATRCPAVLVPFAQGGETEQTDRAERLAALGQGIVVSPDLLDGPRLARAVAGCLDEPTEQPALSLDGARITARHIQLIHTDESGGMAKRR